ncbi:hypothetical protein [Sphingomonas gilva]|uniref:hypothetical protein n=1 Tax=Sphingomonas gilva TaxID=2305907 RepID=UPI0011C3B412|nr:hypothetical protein [Sphingomonas gilva]
MIKFVRILPLPEGGRRRGLPHSPRKIRDAAMVALSRKIVNPNVGVIASSSQLSTLIGRLQRIMRIAAGTRG